MRFIYLPVLLLLISLAGCQNDSVGYLVDTNITPVKNAKAGTYLAEVTVRKAQGKRIHIITKQQIVVLKGKEALTKLGSTYDESFVCRVLIEDRMATTFLLISKKGRVVFSNSQKISIGQDD